MNGYYDPYRQQRLQLRVCEDLTHAFHIATDPRRILKELDFVNTLQDRVHCIYSHERQK